MQFSTDVLDHLIETMPLKKVLELVIAADELTAPPPELSKTPVEARPTDETVRPNKPEVKNDVS